MAQFGESFSDVLIVAGSAFGTGIAAEGIVHWAQSAPASTASGKTTNAPTIASSPYLVGLGFAVVGILLVLPQILARYPWLAQIGLGMFTGGIAATAIEISKMYFGM